jgi:hypothetical protein
MRVDDYFPQGKRWWLRLHEKGGKNHEMPVHHSLEAYLDEYVRAAGIATPDRLPYLPSNRDHDLPDQRQHLREGPDDGPHFSPRTTKLYDRTNDAGSLDEVERVVF